MFVMLKGRAALKLSFGRAGCRSVLFLPLLVALLREHYPVIHLDTVSAYSVLVCLFLSFSLLRHLTVRQIYSRPTTCTVL